MAMNQGMAMMMAAQARRRRDERGRFMENNRGNNQYTQRNEMNDGSEMRRRSMEGGQSMNRSEMRRNEMAYNEMRRNEMAGSPGMGGEGYFVWDGMGGQPYMPPERYGQPQDRRNVTDMRQYRARSHMGEQGEKMQQEKGAIGFGEQDHHGKKLTKEKAEKWVKKMRSDGGKGGMWTMEDAKELAKAYDIEDGQELIDFYAALNMVHSDYSQVAKEFGVDEEEYYAALACAFLYDRDGKQPSEKIAAYYKYVVPHDEEE